MSLAITDISTMLLQPPSPKKKTYFGEDDYLGMYTGAMEQLNPNALKKGFDPKKVAKNAATTSPDTKTPDTGDHPAETSVQPQESTTEQQATTGKGRQDLYQHYFDMLKPQRNEDRERKLKRGAKIEHIGNALTSLSQVAGAFAGASVPKTELNNVNASELYRLQQAFEDDERRANLTAFQTAIQEMTRKDERTEQYEQQREHQQRGFDHAKDMETQREAAYDKRLANQLDIAEIRAAGKTTAKQGPDWVEAELHGVKGQRNRTTGEFKPLNIKEDKAAEPYIRIISGNKVVETIDNQDHALRVFDQILAKVPEGENPYLDQFRPSEFDEAKTPNQQDLSRIINKYYDRVPGNLGVGKLSEQDIAGLNAMFVDSKQQPQQVRIMGEDGMTKSAVVMPMKEVTFQQVFDYLRSTDTESTTEQIHNRAADIYNKHMTAYNQNQQIKRQAEALNVSTFVKKLQGEGGDVIDSNLKYIAENSRSVYPEPESRLKAVTLAFMASYPELTEMAAATIAQAYINDVDSNSTETVTE